VWEIAKSTGGSQGEVRESKQEWLVGFSPGSGRPGGISLHSLDARERISRDDFYLGSNCLDWHTESSNSRDYGPINHLWTQSLHSNCPPYNRSGEGELPSPFLLLRCTQFANSLPKKYWHQVFISIIMH
jgi:hypothetical protein